MKNELGHGAVLRFHPGGHTGPKWMLADGMFWFQGEYLTKNRTKSPGEAADFEAASIEWISSLRKTAPYRAYAHALYLKETYNISGHHATLVNALLKELTKDSNNIRYVEGLQAVEDFCRKKLARHAQKGNTLRGHSDPDIEKAATKLADEYKGVPVIEEVFRSLAKPTI